MKKKKCETCGHFHKKSAGRGKKGQGRTSGWVCMKKGCNCGNFVVAGERVK